MTLRGMVRRLRKLELIFKTGPVYVAKVEGWGFGIRFPGTSKEVKRDWEWDVNRLIGASYTITSEPPGRRFDTREEAEAWVAEDKKNYPKEKFSWQQKSEARKWLRGPDGKILEKIPRFLVEGPNMTKEQIRQAMENGDTVETPDFEEQD